MQLKPCSVPDARAAAVSVSVPIQYANDPPHPTAGIVTSQSIRARGLDAARRDSSQTRGPISVEKFIDIAGRVEDTFNSNPPGERPVIDEVVAN